MNREAVCSVLLYSLRGPLDGASPLWNKGIIACTTYTRGEPTCKHCRTVVSCPVIRTPWISSRTFCVSVEKLASPLRISTLLNRSCIGFLSQQSAKRWATNWPTSISMCRRSRSRGRAAIAFCGAKRPILVVHPLRGYPETFLHCCNEIKQHPCGNETRGDRRGRVC